MPKNMHARMHTNKHTKKNLFGVAIWKTLGRTLLWEFRNCIDRHGNLGVVKRVVPSLPPDRRSRLRHTAILSFLDFRLAVEN